MKPLKSLLVLLSFISITLNAQILELGVENNATQAEFENGEQLLKYMMKKYRQAPCRAYTFTQKNTLYRNDSIIGNSTWYESIEFPDKFRIDFDDKTKGNYVIYKNDSAFYFRSHKLKKSNSDQNILLLLLGGMYYREPNNVINRLKKANFNINLLSIEEGKFGKIYIIGAKGMESSENQIWIEGKDFKILKIIQTQIDKSIMEITFDEHKENCKGYTETKVTFKRDGKVEQVEKYDDIKTVTKFPPNTFKTK